MRPPKYPHVERFLRQHEGEPEKSRLRLYIQAVAELANDELEQSAPTRQGRIREDVRIVDLLVYGYVGRDVSFASFSRRAGPEEIAEGRARLWRAVEGLPESVTPAGIELRLLNSDIRTLAGIGNVRTPDGRDHDLLFHHPEITLEDAIGLIRLAAKAIAARTPRAS